MSFKEVNSERRQDWHQTSTGVGHHYRPGYYFPGSDFKTFLNEPIPPTLATQDNITNDQKYDTTSGNAYDRKYPGSGYDHPIYKKAPGHWKVNYVKDLAEKLGSGGWRRPLTMGNQKTEAQDQYDAKTGVREKYAFDDVLQPRPFILSDHHNEGPTKYGCATTQNPKLQGEPWYVRDKGVLRHLDPYLTTTHKDHRSFKPDELKRYPKKDIATHYDCEGYPKIWGHGVKHNPVPKDAVKREPLPMVDPTWFKTRTKVPRRPKSMVPVPHSGLKTLYGDSYIRPSDVKAKEAMFCPVDTPYTLPVSGAKSVMTVPKMYNTEYENIGSENPIMV